jgi:hypothetical protein
LIYERRNKRDAQHKEIKKNRKGLEDTPLKHHSPKAFYSWPSEGTKSVTSVFSVVQFRFFRPFLLLALGLVLAIAGMTPLIAGAASAQGAKNPKQSHGEVDVQRLAGRWVRSDGGYRLEFREVHEGGSIKAAYFNPRPINVSQAVWARQGGKITLLVELRDVNYPGSTYNLEYDAKSDRLKGTYFQAVEKQTYDVQFMRAK